MVKIIKIMMINIIVGELMMTTRMMKIYAVLA